MLDPLLPITARGPRVLSPSEREVLANRLKSSKESSDRLHRELQLLLSRPPVSSDIIETAYYMGKDISDVLRSADQFGSALCWIFKKVPESVAESFEAGLLDKSYADLVERHRKVIMGRIEHERVTYAIGKGVIDDDRPYTKRLTA